MSNTPQTGPDDAFQAHIADGQLWLQMCQTCDTAIFMPRVICPHCSSLALDWVPATGGGTIYSRAVLHRRPKPGGVPPVNHAIVLVDLDEGPRIMSSLPETAPDDVHIGMRVRARITGEDGARIVVFDLEENVA